MKTGLSRRLAWGNICKNYRFFIPRILSETGLLACFYIIYTLACDSRLASVKGGSYLPTFMWMGAVVIGLLSLILTLYTNSFLMKQRRREFGLYSVLGMEKKHICRVLFRESLICTAISVAAGLLCGMLFYKLCSLAICRLLKAEIIAGMYFVTPKTILPAGAAFILMDALAFGFNCMGIGSMKPVELLSDASTGEKEPRVKWLMLILGVVTLGGGYAISLTTKNPLQALLLFFAAVLLVIAGTYFLYISGSIFVLKALKRRDGYYYKPGHFTAVSGLLYRMKQNAVGLASVAILATGVLVMSSTTFCLYSRTESVLKATYPQDCYIGTVFYTHEDGVLRLPDDFVTETIKSCAEEQGLHVEECFPQELFDVTYDHLPGELVAGRNYISTEADLTDVCSVTFITEKTYVTLGGKALGLHADEVAVSPYSINTPFGEEHFTLAGREFRVAATLGSFPIPQKNISVSSFGMVVADDAVFSEIYEAQQTAYGPAASELQYRYCVSFDDRAKCIEVGDDFAKAVDKVFTEYVRERVRGGYRHTTCDAMWDAREGLYGMYGTLLFLGILLGIVCMFATVLIIYYKQISEGYEDRARYQIMQKIGMTEREVKSTIRSQIMLVFFLPLVTAGVHVAFAYPILTRLMEVMMLDNAWLFAKWCVIVYLVFAAVYSVIYKLTARTYYKIVY